jgi:hypothetical protein
MSDMAREWADRAGKAQEAVSALGAGPPASRLADDDRELAARAREVGARLRRRPGDLDRLAGVLLARMADRLDGHAAAYAFCKRCEAATASVPCPRCGAPACAGCGRCPPCDGPVPDGEE